MTGNAETTLPRKAPEELGISAQHVLNFLDKMKAQSIELHSFMLMRHGYVAAEGWWKPYASEIPHMLFSLSKSFTSTAIGMAVEEGILTLNDPVISFFSDELPEEVSPNLAAMQIRDLLVMGTGHSADILEAMYKTKEDNWVRAFLQQPVEHEPGSFFLYNTGATYMLSAILQKASGQTLLEFLAPRLFEPLGINPPTWETCPRGIPVGGYGLSLYTEDIAKFGQLYLQQGMWRGQRLISESWIEAATSKQISTHEGDSDWSQGYGYQFWRCHHGAYRGDGAFGQFCIVLPEVDAVIAFTSGTNNLQGLLNGVWDHLLEGFRSHPITPDASSAELQRRLQELRLDPPQLGSDSQLESRLNGLTFTLEENDLEITSLSIDFQQEAAKLRLKSNQGEHSVTMGRGNWMLAPSTLIGEEQQLAASFTWKTPDKLLLTIRQIEAPFTLNVEVGLYGQEIEVRSEMSVSSELLEVTVIRGSAVVNC